MINREKHLEDYGYEPDPLFEIIDDLLYTINKGQSLLADYLPPGSKVTDDQVINDLLGVLDDEYLIKRQREIESEGVTNG